MKIRSKILLLLLVSIIVMIISIVGFLYIESKQTTLISDSNLESQKQATQNLLNYISDEQIKYVKDYSFWDEMVNFVKHPTKEWAKDNLDVLFDTYNVDYVWVFNTDYQPVYYCKRSNKFQDISIPFSIFPDFYKKRFIKYFSDKEILTEIFGATIHYSDDVQRVKNPEGFFILGKLWDDAYIAKLESITTRKVIVADTGKTVDTIDKSLINSWITLNDEESNPIKKLIFSKENSFITQFTKLSKWLFLITLLLSSGLLVIFIAGFQRMVNQPLKTISKSLSSEDPSILNSIIESKNEFSEIGSLISTFFEQKASMQNLIEEYKQTLSDLKNSEDRYKNLFDNLIDGVGISKDGYFFKANKSLLSLFGYNSFESIASVHINDLIHYEFVEVYNKECRKMLSGNSYNNSIIVKIKKQDNQLVDCDISIQRTILDGQLFIQNTFRDISDKINIQKELFFEKAYFQGLFENSPEAIIITDKNDQILKVNKAFTSLFGYERSEVIGYVLSSVIIPANQYEESTKYLNKVLNGETVFYETRRKHKNGNIFDVSFLGTPIYTKDELIGSYGIYRNITEQKQSELAILKAKEKAEQSDRLKSSFLANISHEFRTPMNGILGFSEILNKEEIPDEEKAEYIQYISNSINQLLAIFNDIIDISKLQTGDLSIEKIDFDLDEMMKNIQNFFIKQLELSQKHDIELIYLEPKPSKIGLIFSDQQRITQVITNLMNNAIKFTSRGYIEFGYSHIKYNEIQFFVKDTGIGIPEEKNDVIFDRFRQADDSMSRNYSGTGLGLSINKGIISLLGGNIWFDSTVNVGTTFYFTVPFEKPADNQQEKQAEPEKSSFPDFSKKVFIVAEDVDSNYMFIVAALKKTKATLLRATNGREVLSLIEEHPETDLVLMDIQMPEISGIEATFTIKQKRSSLPVIVITAHAFEQDKIKSFEAGCDDFIPKPIDYKLLIEKIQNLVK